MAGYLTTHVLDLVGGCPASGVEVTLWRLTDGSRDKIGESVTNADGRTDAPILPEAEFAPGTYELVFEAGLYQAAMGRGGAFLGQIPIRFTMESDTHHHVPLLLSTYGYSTYRGS